MQIHPSLPAVLFNKCMQFTLWNPANLTILFVDKLFQAFGKTYVILCQLYIVISFIQIVPIKTIKVFYRLHCCFAIILFCLVFHIASSLMFDKNAFSFSCPIQNDKFQDHIRRLFFYLLWR